MASVPKIWVVLSDRTLEGSSVSCLPIIKKESNSAPISSYSILSDHKVFLQIKENIGIEKGRAGMIWEAV